MANSSSGDGTGGLGSARASNQRGVHSADDSSPQDLADTDNARADDKVGRDSKNAQGARRDDRSGSGPSASGHEPGRKA